MGLFETDEERRVRELKEFRQSVSDSHKRMAEAAEASAEADRRAQEAAEAAQEEAERQTELAQEAAEQAERQTEILKQQANFQRMVAMLEGEPETNRWTVIFEQIKLRAVRSLKETTSSDVKLFVNEVAAKDAKIAAIQKEFYKGAALVESRANEKLTSVREKLAPIRSKIQQFKQRKQEIDEQLSKLEQEKKTLVGNYLEALGMKGADESEKEKIAKSSPESYVFKKNLSSAIGASIFFLIGLGIFSMFASGLDLSPFHKADGGTKAGFWFVVIIALVPAIIGLLILAHRGKKSFNLLKRIPVAHLARVAWFSRKDDILREIKTLDEEKQKFSTEEEWKLTSQATPFEKQTDEIIQSAKAEINDLFKKITPGLSPLLPELANRFMSVLRPSRASFHTALLSDVDAWQKEYPPRCRVNVTQEMSGEKYKALMPEVLSDCLPGQMVDLETTLKRIGSLAPHEGAASNDGN